jgi:multiple sugar transport system substrate-binding protein
VRGRGRTPGALAIAALLVAGVLAACDSSGSPDASSTSATPTGTATSLPQLPPQTLTFGVIGSAGEIDQYRTMAETYAAPDRKVTVHVEGWPNDAAMLESFREGERVPDVFLATRRRLSYLVQHQLIQPVDQLLDDRGFDFGDEYPRSTLTAFGNDNRLQCLPYGIQPSVIFYNTRLVQFNRIRNDPPTAGEGWDLDQFAEAGRWAVNHHPGIAGIYLDPSIFGLSPFLYSGGGEPFNDSTEPTSLAFSEDTNRQTLIQTVRALQAPGAVLSAQQLERHTPLEWFAKGRLALLEGSRQMVPDLRSSGIRFDVMPMPTLGTSATVGQLSGLCLSSHPRDVATASDFLVYASSPGALELVSYAGYLQPANQTVALSDAFQQPGKQPRHASVFTFSVKSIQYPPVVGESDELDLAVGPLIQEMMDGIPADVPRLTRRIDRASYRILGPKFGPTPSPTQPAG